MKFGQLAASRGGLALTAGASGSLDAVRGLAALYIVFHHIRGLFFVQDVDVSPEDLPGRLLCAILGEGPHVVQLFFVLSGFVIARSIAVTDPEKSWSFTTYAVKRLTRLWVVLLPALFLTAFWDRLGIHLFGSHGVYAQLVVDGQGRGYSILPRTSAWVALGNVLFLQPFRCTAFGSDSPLWSLAYEFWYYVFFPLLLGVLFPRTASRSLLQLLVLAVLPLFVGKALTAEFPAWLLGALLLLIPRARFGKPVPRALVQSMAWLALVGSWLVVEKIEILPRWRFLLDYVTAAFAAIALHLNCAVRPVDSSLPPEHSGFSVGRWIAPFSFSLYLVHMPLLTFIHAGLQPQDSGRWEFDPLHLAAGTLLAGVCVAYAYVFAACTERHTAAVRRWAFRTFHRWNGEEDRRR